MSGGRRPRRKGVASTFMRHDDTDDTDLQPQLESSMSRDHGRGQVTASSSPMAQPEEEHFEGDHVEDDDEELVVEAASSSSSSKLYARGITRLPDRAPARHARALITPCGDRNFVKVDATESSSTSDVPIRPRQPSSVRQMATMQTAFQSQLEELRARQDELQEALRREVAARYEAYRRDMEAQQQHTQRQISDLVSYFQSIQSSTAPPLPASLFAPPPVPPPVPTPAGSPHQSWGSNPTPSPGSEWQVSPYGHPSTQHTWPGAHLQHGHPGLSGSPPPRPGYSYPYQSALGQAIWAPWVGGSSPHPGGHSPWSAWPDGGSRHDEGHGDDGSESQH